MHPRVIPTILIDGHKTVKTIKFKRPLYVGDPLNIIRIFNSKEVDELCVLDISKERSFRGPNFSLLDKLSSECLMPLSYGGGIRHVDDARHIFNLGFEKVIIQNSAISNPDLLHELSSVFGSQSIVFALDVRKSLFGGCKPHSLRLRYTHSIHKILQNMITHGAGEILINLVHCDGTLQGMDLSALKNISLAIHVPIIFAGGINSIQNIKEALASGADAVSVGSYFVFKSSFKGVLISYLSTSEFNYLSK